MPSSSLPSSQVQPLCSKKLVSPLPLTLSRSQQSLYWGPEPHPSSAVYLSSPVLSMVTRAVLWAAELGFLVVLPAVEELSFFQS